MGQIVAITLADNKKLEDYIKTIVHDRVAVHGGNMTTAAKSLGIARATI